MLTTLPALKTRLSIPDTDPQYDDLLTSVLETLSARFDNKTNRTLARTVNATFEFDPATTEICPGCYPIESVSKFELKTTKPKVGSNKPVPTTSSATAASSPCITHSSLVARHWLASLIRAVTSCLAIPRLPARLRSLRISSRPASSKRPPGFLRHDMLGLDTSWPKGGILSAFPNSISCYPSSRSSPVTAAGRNEPIPST